MSTPDDDASAAEGSASAVVAASTAQANLAPAMQAMRDAAKWLLAAAAGVGSVVVAGVQLSSIGKLPACQVSQWRGVDCARLPISVACIAVALLAAVAAIWAAARLLAPVGVTFDEFLRAWHHHPRRADVQFFRENRHQLGGFRSPGDLDQARTAAWDLLVAAQSTAKAVAGSGDPVQVTRAAAAVTAAADEFARYNNQIGGLLHIAQFQLLQRAFRRLLRKVLVCALLTAAAVTTFAWAANPPDPQPVTVDLHSAALVGADLRGADLRGADLSGAVLTGADLTGARLDGARLVGVTWSGTTCPDGSSSDAHDHTCQGHLTP